MIVIHREVLSSSIGQAFKLNQCQKKLSSFLIWFRVAFQFIGYDVKELLVQTS